MRKTAKIIQWCLAALLMLSGFSVSAHEPVLEMVFPIKTGLAFTVDFAKNDQAPDTVQYTLASTDEVDRTTSILLARYDREGRMQSLTSTVEEVPAGVTVTGNLAANFLGAGAVRAFAWDDDFTLTTQLPAFFYPNPKYEEGITVHYIDVGQADSALILCGRQTMMIDGGNKADKTLVINYLKDLDISYLDYVICTHPHEDHVGGLPGILTYATAGTVYAPVTEASTQIYRQFKENVSAQGAVIDHVLPGDTFTLGESEVTILGPTVEPDKNLNNVSIVLKIAYEDVTFLFTGDAEKEEEALILQNAQEKGLELSANVLKTGHHGSDTSTSDIYLEAVSPQYAVISVGEGNTYGHPKESTLQKLANAGVYTLRTDELGHIVAHSDGKTITFTSQKNQELLPPPEIVLVYIGNKNSKVFHLPSCSSLPKEENRVYFNSTEEAVDAGYTPCSRCKP